MDQPKREDYPPYPPSWGGDLQGWEDLCQACGRCCHSNIIFSNASLSYLGETASCKYLADDGSCSVYEERFNCNKNCWPITVHVINNTLPTGCAYEPFCDKTMTKPHFEAETPEQLEKLLREESALKASMFLGAVAADVTPDQYIEFFVKRITDKEFRERYEAAIDL